MTRNYYIRDFGDGPELVFRDDNASTADTSTVRISNVVADVIGDGTGLTFYPSRDFTLRRSPSKVISDLGYTFAQGTVNEDRPATAAAFNGERGGVASNTNIKTAAKASEEARQILWTRHTEEDVLEGEILVPRTAVNLLNHGDRLQVKFEDMTPEGYGSFAWCRVLEATKIPLLKAAAKYRIRLKLSPQEAAEPTCAYPATADGIYYPLGGPGPLGGGNANPSDGVVYYLRPGIYYPQAPMPGAQSYWHFPQYGAAGGGETTIDYMGDCTQNTLRFIVVGDGTASIQTSVYEVMARNFNLSSFRPDGTGYTFHGRFASGDLVEVEIDDTSAPDDCVRIIDINAIGGQSPGESCGGKMGWSSMTWVGA